MKKRATRKHKYWWAISPPVVYVDQDWNIKGVTSQVYFSFSSTPYQVWVRGEGNAFRVPALEGVNLDDVPECMYDKYGEYGEQVYALQQLGYEIIE